MCVCACVHIHTHTRTKRTNRPLFIIELSCCSANSFYYLIFRFLVHFSHYLCFSVFSTFNHFFLLDFMLKCWNTKPLQTSNCICFLFDVTKSTCIQTHLHTRVHTNWWKKQNHRKHYSRRTHIEFSLEIHDSIDTRARVVQQVSAIPSSPMSNVHIAIYRWMYEM